MATVVLVHQEGRMSQTRSQVPTELALLNTQQPRAKSHLRCAPPLPQDLDRRGYAIRPEHPRHGRVW